jgi:hypothetical protein
VILHSSSFVILSIHWRNKLILYIYQFQCNVFVTVFHSVQVSKLQREITVHVKDVQKISGTKKEISGLKKAVNDTVNYLESNRSLVSHWFSTVSVWCLIQGGPKVGIQYIVYSILYIYFWPILYVNQLYRPSQMQFPL